MALFKQETFNDSILHTSQLTRVYKLQKVLLAGDLKQYRTGNVQIIVTFSRVSVTIVAVENQ